MYQLCAFFILKNDILLVASVRSTSHGRRYNYVVCEYHDFIESSSSAEWILFKETNLRLCNSII